MTNNAMTITTANDMPKATHRDRLRNSIIGCMQGFGASFGAVALIVYGAALIEESTLTNNLYHGIAGIVLGLGGFMGVAIAAIPLTMRLFSENNLCKGCTAAFMAAGAAVGLYAATHTNTAIAMGSTAMDADNLTIARQVDEGLRQDFGAFVPKR